VPWHAILHQARKQPYQALAPPTVVTTSYTYLLVRPHHTEQQRHRYPGAAERSAPRSSRHPDTAARQVLTIHQTQHRPTLCPSVNQKRSMPANYCQPPGATPKGRTSHSAHPHLQLHDFWLGCRNLLAHQDPQPLHCGSLLLTTNTRGPSVIKQGRCPPLPAALFLLRCLGHGPARLLLRLRSSSARPSRAERRSSAAISAAEASILRSSYKLSWNLLGS